MLPRPVVAFAIEPKSSADIEKISLGLHKLIEEDPTLEFSRHADTKEMVLSGMGQVHIDLALEKLRRKYGAEVVVHMPKIPYRETIRATAQAQGNIRSKPAGMASTVIAGLKSRLCRAVRDSNLRTRWSAALFRAISFPRWRREWLKPCITESWRGFLSSIAGLRCTTVIPFGRFI